ncbi:4-hydroxy-tetrahydrodipicolinate synthase [Paraburkholderia sp. SEWSISQ10-3 4]|uniref:4-hydroxy-tetrahydrodipicolinate synthase n=1 Tax=Paraburkholderia TaxID=1822464 RepID=UPI001B13F226|nr:MULTISPECIES: 4-hydroxy-tetrahydrodipicolinate synthase [Paraburkholderia]MCX4142807.1 4-hydroxy-tetrahydrodipicolinate synthase [Paraburkholderia aspalathi]MDN7175482.1 4-hydroxy-tetrahydrodipicolinate synthase [Paraburkholderia sp. SEWSISQ10-3 4]MDQ6505123.1 4-hydroxy-tetrahydrodipicolinate synthase [Paraburkholderia aspalathi]CAE6809812.1 4-hydroxy-tetrahydrodipicolinate synthase [Paraburkholderia aspalathi]
MSIFSGIWVPLITPFADGEVDHAALRALVRRYADAGIAGLVALGTTGEPAALDDAEQDAVLATILDEARAAAHSTHGADARALPVLVGVSGNHTASMKERIEQLNALPIAGVLMAAPYYIRPSQAGIVGHFMALADASDKPVVLYDIPYRTGVRLELDTLLTLAAHPRIQAVKDCAGSLDTTLALIRDGRLQVLTGEDINIFNTLCLGGSGAIAASAHLRPERFVALYRALSAGRLDEGRRIFHELAPLIQALFAEPNPAPVKALLAAQGLIRDELRMPMTRAGDALVARLRELEGFDRIEAHAAV